MDANITNTQVEENLVEVETLPLEDLVAEIVEAAKKDEWGPYAIATAANQVFKALEFNKEIPPQMMYTYDKNGMIVKGNKSKKRYTNDEVAEFLVKYVTRTTSK